MITEPIGIAALLLGLEGLIFYLAEAPKTKRFFSVIPPMFWIYFLPLLASTFGVLPQKSDVYGFISSYFLPASLILLFISVDIRSILKLGKTALVIMFIGSLGILIGGPVTLFIFKPWLPEGIWSGFGALSGSWIGGSANMLAVKEAIGTPDNVFLPMVVVDTICAYSWMGFLIVLAGFQKRFDRWNKSNTAVVDELNSKIAGMEKMELKPLSSKAMSGMIAIAFAGTYLSTKIAKFLPEVKNVISTYTWTIIIVSTIGILLSFTKTKKLESYGASKLGYIFLYFVLASIGARASLADIASAPILILAGFVWIGIHALFLLIGARLFRVPLFLAATASQANIGGPASAPVVAAIYQPALAPAGLLLAVVGNILGTYLGILCSQLCRWVN